MNAFGIDMPANLEAERAVLGAILDDDTNFVTVASSLNMSDFSVEKNRRIFRPDD